MEGVQGDDQWLGEEACWERRSRTYAEWVVQLETRRSFVQRFHLLKGRVEKGLHPLGEWTLRSEKMLHFGLEHVAGEQMRLGDVEGEEAEVKGPTECRWIVWQAICPRMILGGRRPWRKGERGGRGGEGENTSSGDRVGADVEFCEGSDLVLDFSEDFSAETRMVVHFQMCQWRLPSQ